MYKYFVLGLVMLTSTLFGEPSVGTTTLQDLFPGLSGEELTRLTTEKEITRYYFEPVPPKWLPKSGLSLRIAEDMTKIETVIGVESIHFLPYSEIGIYPGEGGDADPFLLKIYNVLRSVSTMKGLQYYSVTRGRMHTLFAESYAIAGPDNQTRIPDPLVETIPEESVVYVFQEDLTFGKNITRWVYRWEKEEFSVSSTNLTPMKYGILTMADPEQMQTHLLIQPMRDGISFYGCAVVKSIRFLGLEKRSKESLYNRIKAIYSWFEKEISEE
ncbi:MAG TPA: hypothetical protein PLG79_01825 [Spirochaetales bacterium]|nr:hypothetical protein [Spirochaetales bacterium]